MTTNTILLLLLSLIIAVCLSFFQYYYKVKTKSKVNLVLAFLRFISIFCLLLLLVNPIISKNTLEIVKTPLVVVVDNSSSIIDLKANQMAVNTYKKIAQNESLIDKFDLQSFQFDSEFLPLENFNFKGKQTNIDEVAKNLKNNFKNTLFPTVLLTDGNQTSGNDFVYSFDQNNKVYPIILGDTTAILDLKVSQLNVNKYAFSKNKFPVEVFLQYSGNKKLTANFSISQGNSIISKQSVSFSSSKKSVVISVLLPANKVGLQVFKASILSKEKEKNTYNNSKNFAVEVVEQKTNIAIFSAINHPDIGALKRAIESNAQRKVSLLNPLEINNLQNFSICILYQPTTEFKSVFEKVKTLGMNSFIITGTNTDFNFLNQQQSNLNFKMSSQKEDYLASFNSQFSLFSLEDFGFDNFPPLQNSFGTITTNGNVSTLLKSKIRNIETSSPLLTFAENQGNRSAFLLGENSWRWRAKSHLDTKSFEKYDLFIDKIIQYLASNDSKKSLIVEHNNLYNSGDAIEISAQYFNKNYEFDEKARLSISITNLKTKEKKNYDLLRGKNAFKVNLEGLVAGHYTFVIKELNSNSVFNSYFEILDFDIEKQFVNPDILKLSQLATETKGQVYYPNQTDALIKSLLENEKYNPIQKSVVTKTPLIDWILLLILIALSLSAEWFIRKYNGML